MPDHPDHPLRVTGVSHARQAPTLIVSLTRPVTLDEAAGVLGTLKRHVNGEGTAPTASEYAAQRMLDALRLALPELREDLEALVESNTPGARAYSASVPLPPDLDEDVLTMARDKKAAFDAVVAAIAMAEGR